MVFILKCLSLTNTVLAKTQKLAEALFPQEIWLKVHSKAKWFWTTFFLYFWCTGISRNVTV